MSSVDVIYGNPQMLRSCYGLSTSDVFFQPYSPYRKLLYLPWRDQLRDAARRIKSVYGDDKDLIEAAKVEHQREMQTILGDNAPMPTRPKYSVGYHKVGGLTQQRVNHTG